MQSTVCTITEMEQTGTIRSVCHNEAGGGGVDKVQTQAYVKRGEG